MPYFLYHILVTSMSVTVVMLSCVLCIMSELPICQVTVATLSFWTWTSFCPNKWFGGYFQSPNCSYCHASILYLLAWYYHLWTEAIRPTLPLLSGPRLVLGGFDLICSVSLLLLKSSVMHKYFRNQNDLWHWTLFLTVGHAGSFVITERKYYLEWRLEKEKGGREGDNKIHLHFKLTFMLEYLLECVSLSSPSPTPIVCLLTIARTFALISFRDIYWRAPKIMGKTEPPCIL